MLQTLFKMLFAFMALGVVSGGAASAEECRDKDDCEARCLHHARVTLQQEEQVRKGPPTITRAVA